LVEAGLTPVARERPGAYGTPVDTIVAGDCTVFLVHAAHATQVPGRTTEQREAWWLANLTRARTTVVQERSRQGNRGHGVLARAHLTLAAVATDRRGRSGRARLRALREGRAAPATRAAWAHGRRRRQLPLLEQALTGLVRDQHRQRRARPWAPLDVLDAPLDTLSGAMPGRLTDLGAGPARPRPPRP